MWQNGEICQVLSTEAFTTFFQACDVTKGSSLPRHHCPLSPHVADVCTVLLLFTPRASVLLTRLSARCLPSSWLYTASFRSCLLLPPGLLDTLEAGTCEGSRACCFFFASHCSFAPRCALRVLATCEEFLFKRCGRLRSCFSFCKFVFSRIVLPIYCLSHSSRSYNRDTPGKRSKMTTSWCSGRHPHELVKNDSPALP